MVSDRGSAPELRPEELEAEWFRCDALHVSGYALMREPVAAAALRAGELARAAGAQVSLDLSSWTLIDDAFRARARALAPDVVFAVEREREALGELDARWVVKRGADGVVVDGVRVPGRADGRRRRDRRRRRVRGGLPRRRRRGRARGGGALLREARGDAVIRARRGGRRRARDGRGVVALETTLVAHGFPPGEGVEVGLASERAVRESGAGAGDDRRPRRRDRRSG